MLKEYKDVIDHMFKMVFVRCEHDGYALSGRSRPLAREANTPRKHSTEKTTNPGWNAFMNSCASSEDISTLPT